MRAPRAKPQSDAPVIPTPRKFGAATGARGNHQHRLERRCLEPAGLQSVKNLCSAPIFISRRGEMLGDTSAALAKVLADWFDPC
jgi:hypothetical protein